jgi:crotonobetainyl-CoA:carnitine CoA-transferase CaiB-like acyl-CoA transferase
MIAAVEHPTAGTIQMAGIPVKLSQNPGGVRLHPPRLGEHTLQVLREAGHDEQSIQQLIDQGVVAGL